ncbi:MAG: BlaI/MecI/CopY family transcriptional regulator [Bacteroidota bacterium]
MERLTQAEEKIMHILWKIKKGFVKDVIAQMPDPKPPYNTVSSVVRILNAKGLVNFKAYGKTYEYFPTLSKNAFRLSSFKELLKDYFDSSHEELVSFLVDKKELTEEDAVEIKKVLDNLSKKEDDK